MKPEENINGVTNQNPQNINGDLSSTTISSIPKIENIDTIEPINNGIAIETIPENNIMEQPVINPVPSAPPVETLDVPTSVQPEPIQTDSLQDNFNSVPVPPVFEEENDKKKKGPNKILIIILIVLLIAGVGLGIYYFLFAARTNAPVASINVKELKLELGENISNNIDDYATISGYDKESCTLDTKDITAGKVGAYKFYITCGEVKAEGTAIIDDSTNPEVITNEVAVVPNATLKIEDFIDTCIDASACTYKFKNEEEVKSSLTKIGKYDIEIIVTDEYNNESTITAKLVVSNEAPVRYLTCTSQTKDVDEIYATLVETYKFGIGSNNNFYNAVKSSEFKFEELEDYKAIKNNYNEETGINNVIGTATFNPNGQSIILKSNKTLEEVKSELNTTFGDMNTIQMYMVINGYTCK